MTSYYVMHCIDGDECLLHHRESLADALAICLLVVAVFVTLLCVQSCTGAA